MRAHIGPLVISTAYIVYPAFGLRYVRGSERGPLVISNAYSAYAQQGGVRVRERESGVYVCTRARHKDASLPIE